MTSRDRWPARRADLCPLTELFGRTFAVEQQLPRYANASSGAACRELLLGRQASRGSVHGRGRGYATAFAAQAAAIAHARTYRDERRTPSNLAVLIETSPVGVAVFALPCGALVSFNREAQRIVESLRNPGQPPEQLLEVMTTRFADRQEIALSEPPIATVMGSARSMHPEKVELSVPDGRSVTVLVNATPIRAEDGGLGSVVVTVQDLAPLRELGNACGLISSAWKATSCARRWPLPCSAARAPTVPRKSSNSFASSRNKPTAWTT